jgi:hypothetical protein
VVLGGVVATQVAGVHKSRAMHKSPTVDVNVQGVEEKNVVISLITCRSDGTDEKKGAVGTRTM